MKSDRRCKEQKQKFEMTTTKEETKIYEKILHLKFELDSRGSHTNSCDLSIRAWNNTNRQVHINNNKNQ
jgi:hypothetical protein